MTAIQARELALKKPKGWVTRIERRIEEVAKEGDFSTLFHLPDKMAKGDTDSIIASIKQQGYEVEHLTRSHGEEANILNINWEE